MAHDNDNNNHDGNAQRGCPLDDFITTILVENKDEPDV